MRHLRLASLLITGAGLALVGAGVALDLGAAWVLAGMLLAWAGIVKIVVVALWRNVANLGEPATAGADAEGRPTTRRRRAPDASVASTPRRPPVRSAPRQGQTRDRQPGR